MTIEVVAGVLVRGGRIFLQQRPPTKDFGFRWESPGGKVEGNESHHEALRRELLEELGIEVDLLPSQQPIWSDRFENLVSRPDRATVVLSFYFVGDRFSGEPMILERQPGIGWFTSGEMMALYLAPANLRAKVVLAAEIERTGP
jgi:8-oxo-dGTP diphosphatase